MPRTHRSERPTPGTGARGGGAGLAPGGWWRLARGELCAALATDGLGLHGREARARLARYGRNEFRSDAEVPAWLQFARRFANPLILILLVASVLSALTGEMTGAAVIVALVLVSVVLDFVQEYRAGQAALRLRNSVALHAQALRDGAVRPVTVTHLVPGDRVSLASGSLVPADGVLVDAKHLFVDQSLLTGESFPVEKAAAGDEAWTGAREGAPHAVFMGTSVLSGTGTMLVCATGRATALGAISHGLAAAPPPTAFEVGARRFGLMIMRITVLLVLFVLMLNVLTHKPLVESFLFALALAVGLTPELLPMVVSVTLARGAGRMADRHVVVKRLASIHDLGAMTVLCTDKTGTLTEASIALQQHADIEGRESDRVLELAFLNSRFESGQRNPLDLAILAHAHVDAAGWRKVDEVPFDFERRRVAVLVDGPPGRLLIVKGAPEDLLANASAYAAGDDGEPRPFDDRSRARARARLDALFRDGYRVLGIAYKAADEGRSRVGAGDERDLVFAGFASFLDPPKATAADAIRTLAASGVAVNILTGDNELVTEHLCATLGIPVRGVLTGAEIDALDDAALRARVERANLCCRASPAQKSRVILALKARGEVVGYLGDGINDAPALRVADVGISVDRAVDVAKAAADLILKKRDLHVLHDGVVEGRRTHANIRKYLMMGTSSNFGNMLSMAAAAAFLPFLPMLPLQVLLNNTLYDVSEIAIPLDRVDEGELAAPQVFDLGYVRRFMLVLGPLSSVFDLITFGVLLAVFQAVPELFRTAWFVESLATQVLVIFVIRTRGSPLASRPHPALVATSLAVIAAAAVLPYTPLAPTLGFVPIPAPFWGVLAMLVVAYLALAEAGKRWFHARWGAVPSRKAG
ncbi:MAG: magnesium-translocating P-type ATPase [Burkholderiales bacterium]